MSAAAGPSALRRRSGATSDRVVRYVMGAFAIAIGGAYLGALIFLVVRGGARLVSFAQFATPVSGATGETGYRVALAAILGGATGFAIGLIPRAILTRRGNARAALHAPRILCVLGALTLVLAARDHLPRFLILLPSETSAGGGIGPEIFNTVFLAILSTLFVAPVGVGAAIYLARFATSKALVRLARIALDTLASLPSIVYGLFGFLVFVVVLKAGYSLAAGACAVSLLNLPLVVAISEEALRNVPREIEDASHALGATRIQTMLRVTLPMAWPGIVSALVLAVGRVFAESAPLIMTAGTTVSRASAYSIDPTRGGETLAVHLWYVNSAGLSPDRDAVSAGTAAALVVLVCVFNVLAARLARLGQSKAT